MVEISTPLLNLQQLKQKIQETLDKPNPDPNDATKKKGYWLQGIVKNCTQFDLKVHSNYFNSGRYETWPSDVAAFSIGAFTAVNGDNAGGGATGGNAWTLSLQQGINVNLSFGWTCPVVGSYKSGIVESINPEDGYQKTDKGGNKIICKNEYQGVDADGNDMAIMFECICSGGQKPVLTITQVKY